jgi:5-methyltetrahydropteroyltriglutamate--homocysteine methyltransferase
MKDTTTVTTSSPRSWKITCGTIPRSSRGGQSRQANFLEYDDQRSGDFRPLRFLPKGRIVVLGLITTKLGQLENKDAIKRRIEEASKFVPLEQLALSPQCGFSSTVHGNDVAVEQQAAKLRLVIEIAREVWGTA